jgi:hypothetical protein
MYKKNVLSYVARMMIFAVLASAIWGGSAMARAPQPHHWLTLGVSSNTITPGVPITVTVTAVPQYSDDYIDADIGVIGTTDYSLTADPINIPEGDPSGSAQFSIPANYSGPNTITLQIAGYSADPTQVMLDTPSSQTITVAAPVVLTPTISASSAMVIPGKDVTFSIQFPNGAKATQAKSYGLRFEGSAAISSYSPKFVANDYDVVPLTYSPVNFKVGEGKKTVTATTSFKLGASKTIEAVLLDNGVEISRAIVTSTDGAGACIGGIAGETSKAAEAQKDHGISNFSSHEDVDWDKIGTPSKTVDLSIIGQGTGYAPAKEQSACVTTKVGNSNPLKGYVWNTNLGFISLFCDGDNVSTQGNNLGIECGIYNYGVKVGEATDDTRKLTGEAWNPAFGYISFSGEYDNGAGVSGDYGVIATKQAGTNRWSLSGYGWTQAGVYLDFTGGTIEIPTEDSLCNIDTAGWPCCLEPTPEICEPLACGGCNAAQLADPTNAACYCCEAGEGYLTDSPVCEVPQCLPPIDDVACCVLPEYTNDLLCKNDPLYCKLVSGGDLCVEFSPEPTFVDSESLPYFPVADCSDGYGMELFLRNAAGDPKDLTNETINLEFVWTDTVKIDQTSPSVGEPFAGESPFTEVGSGGGVAFKPTTISITSANLNEPNKWIEKVSGETGHYKLTDEKKIKSCAPTTAGNVSIIQTILNDVTGFNSVFDNEKFFGKTFAARNDLKLERILYEVITPGAPGQDADTVGGSVTPYDAPAYFKFKPWLEVSKLETTDLKDAIAGYRDIPVNVNVGLSRNSSKLFDKANPKVELTLGYSGKADISCDQNVETAGKKFGFLLEATNDLIAQPSCDSTNLIPSAVSPCKVSKGMGVNGSDVPLKFVGTTSTLKITPQLPGTPAVPQAICTKIDSPTLNSTISYNIEDKEIKYYSNKLPRIERGVLDNFAAIIHGTIYSAMVFSADVTDNLSPSGSQVSNIVRDTAHRQVTKYVKGGKDMETMTKQDIVSGDDTQKCIIKEDMSVMGGTGCSSSRYKLAILVGEEKADYFYGVDVVLGKIESTIESRVLPSESAFEYIGKRILVVEGGNVLINKNVYDEDEAFNGKSQLVIVALSAKDNTGKNVGGNVYIADDVTTLSNVAIVADGSMLPFPMVTDSNNVFSQLKDNSPELKNLNAFYSGSHQESSQLFMKGAVSAKTSMGISSLVDKGRHLNGAYEAVDSILSSMYYDWNAFRLYRGGVFDTAVKDSEGVNIDNCPVGLVVDLACGKCLTVDEQLMLSNDINADVCGEPVSNESYGDQPCVRNPDLSKCDGIQAAVGLITVKVATSSTEVVEVPKMGDLRSGRPADVGTESLLSRSSKPFYLYYSPITSAMLNAEGN